LRTPTEGVICECDRVFKIHGWDTLYFMANLAWFTKHYHLVVE
jgi:hypothetical protein